MRTIVMAGLIGLGLISRAAAQPAMLEGVVRSASAIAGISQFCSEFFLINGPRATAAFKMFGEVATIKAGKRAALQMIDKELRRRHREITATGARQWCSYQRAVQATLPESLFLN